HSKPLIQHLGKHSLAALTPEIIAKYRDDWLAGLDRKDAKERPVPKPRLPNTVRLDLALLGHMFNTAIKEWGIGLPSTPVQNIRRSAPPPLTSAAVDIFQQALANPVRPIDADLI